MCLQASQPPRWTECYPQLELHLARPLLQQEEMGEHMMQRKNESLNEEGLLVLVLPVRGEGEIG